MGTKKTYIIFVAKIYCWHNQTELSRIIELGLVCLHCGSILCLLKHFYTLASLYTRASLVCNSMSYPNVLHMVSFEYVRHYLVVQLQICTS